MRTLHRVFLSIIAGIVLSAALSAQATSIVGTWNFDLGGGSMATVEYKADGSFTQAMAGMTIQGTYTLKGKTLTTVSGGSTTEFSIVATDGKTMTVKRQRDGRTVVYKKK